MSNILDWLIDLEAIDVSVEQVSDVKRLDLSSCELEKLHEDFGLLTQLYSLNLSDNQLSDLPTSMSIFENLGFIDLRSNAFERIPEVLYNINLKSINLSYNKIKRMENLPFTIRVLNLSNNEISNVGSEIGGLLELRTFNASFNHINTVDAGIMHLSNLEILNLEGNYLKEIPYCAQNPNLRQLNLSENMISTLPDLSDSELERLDISTNQFESIYLSGMEDLEELILDDNPLEELHIEEDFAPYLNLFSAEGCDLEIFPNLGAKKHITSLSLSGNKICEIPESIGEYTVLETFDIDDNEIPLLPESFEKLSSLQKLYVKGNPLVKGEEAKILALDLEYSDLVDLQNVEITEAEEKDIKAMNKLLEQLFSLEKDFEYDEEKQTIAFKMLMHNSDATIVVAKFHGLVVGLSTMQQVISTASGGISGVIEDVVVQKTYRKLGIGSRMIDYLSDIAKEKSYKRLQLVADKNNAKALHFYMKKGWKTTNLQVMHYTF